MTEATVDIAVDEPGVLQRVRQRAFDAFLYVGGVSDLAVQVLRQAFRGPYEGGIILPQMEQVGVRSLSIVAITSLFIGMVLALQTAYSLAEFGGKLFVGTVVSLSLVRELSPVLMSLMVGGRVGAGGVVGAVVWVGGGGWWAGGGGWVVGGGGVSGGGLGGVGGGWGWWEGG